MSHRQNLKRRIIAIGKSQLMQLDSRKYVSGKSGAIQCDSWWVTPPLAFPRAIAPAPVEIEAPPQQGAPKGTVINRAVVEFTDIGLVVKDTERDMFLYAFSLNTGKPMPDVEFTLMDNERGYLRTVKSDASGVANTSGSQAHWVLARHGADGTALQRGNGEGGVSVWRHGLRYAWNSPWKTRATATSAPSSRNTATNCFS